MSSDQTADDFFNTLTGFDELAIAKHFDQPLERLIPNKNGGSPFRFQRALAFIHLRRGGAADRDAYQQAMTLSIAEANGYFVDPDPADVDPDDPDTDLGKDDSPNG